MTTGRGHVIPCSDCTILVVLMAAALSTPLLAAPRFFIARFQNHLSPHLQDADQAFVVGDGLIRPYDRHRPALAVPRTGTTSPRSEPITCRWTGPTRSPSIRRLTQPDEVLFVGFGEAVPGSAFLQRTTATACIWDTHVFAWCVAGK